MKFRLVRPRRGRSGAPPPNRNRFPEARKPIPDQRMSFPRRRYAIPIESKVIPRDDNKIPDNANAIPDDDTAIPLNGTAGRVEFPAFQEQNSKGDALMAACSCVAGALFGAEISLIGAFNRPDIAINRKVSSHTRKPLNCQKNWRRFAPVQALKSLFSRSKREKSLFF